MSGGAVPISFLDEINDLMGESSSQGIIPTPSGMSCRLFDYQRFGLRFMVEREQQPHLGMLGDHLHEQGHVNEIGIHAYLRICFEAW